MKPCHIGTTIFFMWGYTIKRNNYIYMGYPPYLFISLQITFSLSEKIRFYKHIQQLFKLKLWIALNEINTMPSNDYYCIETRIYE